MDELALIRFEAFIAALRVLRDSPNYHGDPSYSTIGGKRVRV